MDSKELFDEEENMEITCWILEYLVYSEKFNEYYSFVKENKHVNVPNNIKLFIKYYELTNKLTNVSTYFLIFLMDEIYPLVEDSNNRSEFVQLYCNFYVETLLDELKEYINKPIPMQYKKYLTKLRNLSYNEIMKDETGKRICENTIKKYEKIIKAEKINEVMNLNIDLGYYINIVKENSLKNSLNLFTNLLKSICFANPPVLLQIYNNKDEIYDIISKNDDSNIIIKDEGEEEEEGEEGGEGEDDEEEATEEDTDDERLELAHNSLNIPYSYPHKRQSIYNTIPLPEDKLNLKIRKINPVTKELQIQNSNIHRLDEPHDSAEEVKWDDQSISSSYSNNNNNNNNNSIFPSKTKKITKVKITKTNNNNTYKNGRVRFSQKEVENLMTGVKRFGVGKWKEILSCYEFNSKRTTVDLKDKYRNIQKMALQR